MADKVWSSTSSTDASASGNYAGGTPSTGDKLILNSIGTANLETGLASYTNVLGLTLDILDAFTAKVGLEASGTNNATYLAPGTSGTSNVFVGRNTGGSSGNGSSLILWNGSSGTSNIYVYKTGAKSGTYPSCCIKGTVVNLIAFGGETGFAIRPTETGTLTKLRLLSDENYSPPVVRCGAGATFPTTVTVERGTLYSNSTHSITTLNISGPQAAVRTETDSTGAFTGVVMVEGAKFVHRGTGAITTATVRTNCTLDLTQDAQAKTLDLVYADPDSEILLDNGVAGSITHSAGGTNVPVIVCTGGIGTVKITAPAGMALSIQ